MTSSTKSFPRLFCALVLCVVLAARSIACEDESTILDETNDWTEPDLNDPDGQVVNASNEHLEYVTKLLSLETNNSQPPSVMDLNLLGDVPEVQAQYNCTPVFRDATNETARLVLLNLTSLEQHTGLKTLYNLPMWTLVSFSHGNATIAGECSILLFYLDWCPFSARAAPHFNALARVFPQVNVFALSSQYFYSISMKLGVVGVPSMYMFHNNKLVQRFNGSEFTLPNLVEFIEATTTLKSVDNVTLVDEDFRGPLRIDLREDGLRTLIVSCWVFCTMAAVFLFIRSALFVRIREAIRNQWNEAHQHAHIE